MALSVPAGSAFSVRPPPYRPEHMFPTPKSPTTSLLRRGIDAAVQFATLGEFAVDEAPQPSRRRRPAPPKPWRPGRTASQVVPATAAGRRQGEPPKRLPTRAAVRSLAMRPAPTSSPRPRSRKRAGQPPARPQPCIAE
jgi:hypothetical protein